ncbi:FKBP-type peptidyl-prolyl cis-trans isomerase [Paraglaciecola hydrolytica]|uniref:Peptidyl-prolyl cis-trans isomerase n=1 Tax=Paraglaciecola hydrolytica TaxID=1799789 RepID=A0A136A4K0_9ALTE|nr:FKBP-type peptidyl-prolyl cis-trans isomerase [Paraglaciecola hydrolytica]KXI30151.1 peptidylprolyl isomerase [Paraglaciecola hydrolytica]
MKKALIAILIGSALGLSACQPVAEPVDILKVEVLNLETDEQKQAYAMGASVGQFIESKILVQEKLGVEYDKTIVAKGFIAAIQGQLQMDMQEMQTITQAIEAKVREQQAAMAAEAAAANIAAGQAFLAENAKREGVMVTESGLQYEVLTQGEGEKPVAENTVKVHYRGTLLDGTEFDSSYKRNEPAVFPLSRVISGWTEGVQLMNVGSKFKFFIPSELAYGERATGLITSNSTLIFEVELLEIVAAN